MKGIRNYKDKKVGFLYNGRKIVDKIQVCDFIASMQAQVRADEFSLSR